MVSIGFSRQYTARHSRGIYRYDRRRGRRTIHERRGGLPTTFKTPDGIKVEVKSSAYIQNWAQKKESTPRFSIRQAFAWNPDTDTYSDEKIRDSDIYVFCLHKHRDRETLDVLDVSQWDFYILPTAALERETKEQKTIGLASLDRLGARKVSFGQIYDTIRDLMTASKAP